MYSKIKKLLESKYYEYYNDDTLKYNCSLKCSIEDSIQNQYQDVNIQSQN